MTNQDITKLTKTDLVLLCYVCNKGVDAIEQLLEGDMGNIRIRDKRYSVEDICNAVSTMIETICKQNDIGANVEQI